MSKANGDILVYGRPRREITKNRISKRLKEVLKKQGKTLTCPICGEQFYVYPSHLNDVHRGVVCSKRCATILGNMNRLTHDTDIELILEEWLKKNNVQYEKQVPIDGITIVDFLIEPNTCLYADGDYWHSLEHVKKRDVEIDSKLENQGYSVIRLWGSEIKSGVRPDEILQ